MSGYEVFSMDSLNWGKNPRDVAMVDIAKEMLEIVFMDIPKNPKANALVRWQKL